MTSQDEIKEAIRKAFSDRARAAGLIGGHARAASLSKRQRAVIARKAGIASGAARARKAKDGGQSADND